MYKQKLLPDKMRILSGSMLKLIAVITMLCDHIAGHLMNKAVVIFSIAGHNLDLRLVMHILGRFAFPLFCFLLTEGFIHTRSRMKYGINLFVFALISEIPWNLEHSGSVFYEYQNVFFTLFFGFLGMCVIERFKQKPIPQVLLLLGIGVVSVFFHADYSVYGYVFIILLYALRENEVLRIFAAAVLPKFQYAFLAFLPISMYNGKRGFIKGKVMKYAFYAFYPAHIFVIYLFKYVLR